MMPGVPFSRLWLDPPAQRGQSCSCARWTLRAQYLPLSPEHELSDYKGLDILFYPPTEKRVTARNPYCVNDYIFNLSSRQSRGKENRATAGARRRRRGEGKQTT
jgi:hypothetical protein